MDFLGRGSRSWTGQATALMARGTAFATLSTLFPMSGVAKIESSMYISPFPKLSIGMSTARGSAAVNGVSGG
jgi:hypothetical protein